MRNNKMLGVKMLREDLKYPRMDAATRIFEKLGVEASTRFDENDQDFEYTSCRVEEIEQYLNLYNQDSTTEQERRVLGCFLFEGLNEYVQNHAKEHELFEEVMRILYRDEYIHETEIEYWTNIEEKDEESWWPITHYILRWKNT